MPIPKNIAPQTLNGLKDNAYNYETHKGVIQAHNQLQDSLRAGTALTAAAFTVAPAWGSGAQITAIGGTFKRGQFTIAAGAAGVGANPTVTLNFPTGTFTAIAFPIVTRNGGAGTLPFSYTQTLSALTITMTGTPTVSTSYGFQFMFHASD